MMPYEGRLNEHARSRAGSANWRYGLYTSAGAITVNTVFADLTEATYSGYARQAPAYAAGAINGAGEASSVAPNLTWAHNGGGVANVVRGWFVLDTATGKLVWAEAFAAPRSMGVAGDGFTQTPALTVSRLP